MLLNETVPKCSAFLYSVGADGDLTPRGTAFFLALPIPDSPEAWLYAVTARHVIEGCRSVSSADHVVVRANRRSGGFTDSPLRFARWRGHPDDDEGVADDWLRHKDTPRIDIAACPINPNWLAHFDHVAWTLDVGHVATDELIEEQRLRPGDQTAIAGMYRNHVGQQRILPIVRSGVIAAMPQEPVATALGPMDAFLVETRSVGGLSGSPVYALSGFYRPSGDGSLTRSNVIQTWLLGLVHGHFDLKWSGNGFTEPLVERMNEGIAIVPPFRYIQEVIQQDHFVEDRAAASARRQ